MMTESFLKTVHVFPSKESYETNKTQVGENDLALLPLKEMILDMFFPVGSYYMSADANFNPNNSWGGTWQRVENRFILASGTRSVGATGGQENVTLSGDQIPNHSHSAGSIQAYGNIQHLGDQRAFNYNDGVFDIYGEGQHYVNGMSSISSTPKTSFNMYLSRNISGNTGGTGGGQPHDNMPPYEVAHIWKRTA